MLGRVAGDEAVMGDGPSARADAEFLRWLTGVGDVAFDAMFSARPSAADASADLDEVQIAVDID
jgi:hypothetical protein